MCGIAGVVTFKGLIDAAAAEAAVLRMNKTQASRGPDDEGVWKRENTIFGHRRLSIIDLSSAGHQPMERYGTVITYNGEIYNFKEIREELKKEGYEFNTNTDTEVILAGYNAWGSDIVKKLNGMFVFALWDYKKEMLFLARDRFGIKPLYYYKDNNNIIFASTVKALKQSGIVPDKQNKDALIGFLLLGSVPNPHTTVKNVYSLPSGHYMQVDINGNKRVVQYYNLLQHFKEEENISYEEVVREIRTLLEKSVERQLISDAPLGIFLSGGLDSSTIATLATQKRKEPITTLSVDFEEKEFSERKYQDMVAERIGSNHHRILITKNDFFAELECAFNAMDQPTIDGINTYFIAKAAKEAGLKSVLSGLGGDELFAGYSNFKRISLLRKIQKLPNVLKIPLSFAKLFGDKYKKLSYLFQKDWFHAYLAVRGLFIPEEIAKTLNIDITEIKAFINSLTKEYELPNAGDVSPINGLSYLELSFYMKNQLLKDTDFMAMHHGVEIRVPFLDHHLVEYLAGLPGRLKIKGEHNKQLLIEAVKDEIPSSVYTRKKMGFTFPFEKWLKESNEIKKRNHWSKSFSIEVLDKWI